MLVVYLQQLNSTFPPCALKELAGSGEIYIQSQGLAKPARKEKKEEKGNNSLLDSKEVRATLNLGQTPFSVVKKQSKDILHVFKENKTDCINYLMTDLCLLPFLPSDF